MTIPPPALVVFGGLPGTGKTTLARKLATRLAAVYLRIDTIEQTLVGAGHAVGPTGYAIANALAAENLALGHSVVADCVNPVLASRRGWRQTALEASAHLVEIEVICSDVAAHRTRVENRVSDISGLTLPSWEAVMNRDYESWDIDHLVLDTADRSPEDLIERAETYVRDAIC